MTVPCHYDEQHHTTREIHTFCSDKKKGKKIYFLFCLFPSFGTGHKSRKMCETLYEMLTLRAHNPRADINAKQHFPYSFRKRKIKFIYLLTKVIERWQKVRWKQSVTHSWWNVFFSLSITSFINPRFFFSLLLSFSFPVPRNNTLNVFLCVTANGYIYKLFWQIWTCYYFVF